MILRPYRPEDAKTILSWCRDERSFYQWTAGVMGEYPLTEEQFGFVESLTAFTACEDDEPAGFFTLRNPNGSADVFRFGFVIIDPKRRQKGCGKEMLRLGLEYIRSVDTARTASLGVFENNAPAYHCYRAAGFEEIPQDGKIETYNVLGEEWKCIEMGLDVRKCPEKIVLRMLEDTETDLLKDFLYEAIFIPEGTTPPDRSIIFQPELALYYEGFGNGPADKCIVAVDNGRVIGAVWTRIMNDYGHVDDKTPSLAISLYRKYRGMGIGTRLMKEIQTLLGSCGYKRLSLAVQKANYAVRMYEKAGFTVTDENNEEYIMVCEL